METGRINNGHLIEAFLIGGTLGALAGMFLAPKTGRELRTELKQKGEETLKSYTRGLTGARETERQKRAPISVEASEEIFWEA